MSRHTIRASVNVLVIDNKEVLLSRRKNTGWADGQLVMPGGHIEPRETPLQAAVRELREELGLKVSTKQLDFCCVAQRNSNNEYEYVAYEFVLHIDRAAVKNNEPNRCSELVWVNPEHLPKDVVPDFAAIINRGYLGQEGYLELGYN